MPSEPVPDINIPAPWAAFWWADLLCQSLSLHCIGGFVLTVCMAFRDDVGFGLFLLPHHDLEAIAGRGSALAKKHRVYLQYVAVNTMPETTDTLTELFLDSSKISHLRSDPYDLILSNLSETVQGPQDVGYLVDKLNLDPTAPERYEREQRPISQTSLATI